MIDIIEHIKAKHENLKIIVPSVSILLLICGYCEEKIFLAHQQAKLKIRYS